MTVFITVVQVRVLLRYRYGYRKKYPWVTHAIHYRLPYPVLKTQDFLNLLHNFLFDMLCIYWTLLHTSLSLLYIKALKASLKITSYSPVSSSQFKLQLVFWLSGFHCNLPRCLYCDILALFSIATFLTRHRCDLLFGWLHCIILSPSPIAIFYIVSQPSLAIAWEF